MLITDRLSDGGSRVPSHGVKGSLMQKIVNMAASTGGVAARASCSTPVIYKPPCWLRGGEGGCPAAASGAHLNLHLPTAKTNKRLIDVDSEGEGGRRGRWHQLLPRRQQQIM